jgi:MFS family permease
MVLSALTQNVEQLMLTRLCVGIGVGTIGVTMTTMAAEYAPSRYASFAVGFVQSGWPFGSILTAFVAANFLPGHRWQSLLMGIGALSSALLVLIAVALPESLSFLTLRQPKNALASINAIRRRLRLNARVQLPPAAHAVRGIGVAAIFKDGRARLSLLLWSAVALGYFDLYFVISWIPKLASQAGLPLTQAIYAGATYNLGAFIGTAAVGWIAIRYPLNRVIAGYFGLGTIAMWMFGGVALPVWLTLIMAAVVGITVQGGFNGFWALAARVYPAEMRSAGVGWALGVGRVGAVLGPIVGGMMVGAHLSLGTIFASFAVPLVLAAILTLRIESQ